MKIMLSKAENERNRLAARVKILEEYISEQMPNGNLEDIKLFEKRKKLLLRKQESGKTQISTTFTSMKNSPRKSKKRMFNLHNNTNALSIKDTNEIKVLKKEVLQFKQKAQSLRFQNERLQKLLSESKHLSLACSVES